MGQIFPDLFKPLEDMPADLRAHVRYPEGIFRLQTAMFSTYHMTNPAVFYNKEDQWEVPSIDMDGRATQMEPYYTIMKLPGEQDAEFIQMLPFTPRRKANLAAWMVARSDGEHYGKLLVFQFPKQKVVFGPQQIVARINQDQDISPQITLWNQQGSQVIQGTLLVIPIEESLIYIRPLYLRAAGGRIPELKRVIVAYQNQIVMEETLALALDRLFGRSDAEIQLTSREPAELVAPLVMPLTAVVSELPGAEPRSGWRTRRAGTMNGPSRRSGRASGACTATRSPGWVTFSNRWPHRNSASRRALRTRTSRSTPATRPAARRRAEAVAWDARHGFYGARGPGARA